MSFVFGSCLAKSLYPFDHIRGLSYIRQHLLHKIDMALLLGDLTYTDIHTRIPWRLPFSHAYSQVWGDADFQYIFQRIPTFSMFDDHEIYNDYGGGRSPLVDEALHFYQLYAGSRNPPSPPNHYFYSFQYASLADFFVMDVRTRRNSTSMLGQTQKDALKKWLSKPLQPHQPQPIKFIVSPVSFSRLMPGDGWNLYVEERDEILDLIEVGALGGVVILSGDLHYGAVFQLRPSIFEFSASPFQALPFAAPSNLSLVSASLPCQNNSLHPNQPFQERVVFLSSLKYHFGLIELHRSSFSVPQPQSWTLKCQLFEYFLDEPRIAFEFTLRSEDLCHIV
eukprot:TRINITY_DN13209_c0_g1_i1.p1 TRINITY_DN13209_c0_g1~~TRINITY_DN13209_c0_g1_i1.p1  ORF type:complete len:354 (+),score=13.22 TRINITY_DN13209_c0_g1_i1:57-1064(+)